MPQIRQVPQGRTTFSLKLGRWFEAHATGWGVVCVPIVVLLVLAAAAAVRQLG